MTVSAITLFAGAGGWDSGFAACGVPVLASLNHNKRSLATHALNFPATKQVLTDITTADPTQYPHATILEASPECRYHSHSRGKKLLDQNMTPLWEGWTDGELDDPATRSRVTMDEVVRWARVKISQGHPFELIYVENVEECGYRMLSIEEYKRAMGYPPSFRFECSKTETLRQIGLSVTPATAAMLIKRGLTSLGHSTDLENVA